MSSQCLNQGDQASMIDGRCTDLPMSQALSSLLPDVHNILSDLAGSDRYWDVLHVSFGVGFDQTKALALQQQWRERDFSQIPSIELVT
jgi:hypothetical protein